MSAEHTPGPWKVIPSPHGPRYACVQIGENPDYTTLELEPTDARLIAAAPDMLAALQAIREAIEELAMVRQAIAKANAAHCAYQMADAMLTARAREADHA